MFKKPHFSKREQVPNKNDGTVLLAAMKVNSPPLNLPTLLPLGNAADFNICKFIFPRLYFPDHHLSRHCQLLICVLKVSLMVLNILFSM